MFWKKKAVPKQWFDAEFDIENRDVFSVEREDGQTVIGLLVSGRLEQWYLDISLEKHADMVARLRKKLDLCQ